MSERLRSAARRVLPAAAQRVIRDVAGRVRYAAGTAPLAAAAMRRAFANFEPRSGSRARAVREIAVEAARLRRLATRTAGAAEQRAFFDALLASATRANVLFRPSALQSYVDVSVRVAAIRALAEYVARGTSFAGDAANVTAPLAEHASGDRAALLAHAELLLDRSRTDEATPLVQRALRMNSACPTAQQLLARAVDGVDYDLRGRFCPMPFTHLSTSYQGDAIACCCLGWVPYPIGNVIDAPSADAVWNSGAAQEIRRSIHDGDFRYCARTLCPYIAARTLPRKDEVTDPVLRRYIDERAVVLDEPPGMVQMNHDQTCNLACPSCRTEVVTAGPAEQRVYVDAADRVLLPLMRTMDGLTLISGGGEAFASAHYKKILAALNRREFPGLDVFLITNGQLLDARRWAELPNLPEMIGNLSVSIDAARAETYERLRRPGKWKPLMQNLELMARMRAAGTIRRFQINFVVQSANFRELPEFIALGDRLGVDSFWLQRVSNYGAYAEPDFAEAEVTSPLHPDHAELLAILRQPLMSDPRIDMSMLLPLLPEAVQSEGSNPFLRTRPRVE